jgi:hypothetical protein
MGKVSEGLSSEIIAPVIPLHFFVLLRDLRVFVVRFAAQGKIVFGACWGFG